jgi:hypothetical protein
MMLLATIPSSMVITWKVGALEVGKRYSFVWTSVSIILFNYILTQLLLDHDRDKRHRKSFGETKILKGISTFLKPENEPNYWTKWLW